LAQYDINLREHWRILKKRKFVVILIAILFGVFSTVFAILRAPTPLYTSVCSIKFEKQTTVEGLYAKSISWSEGDDVETQVSIIKGHLVFQEVAEKLGLILQKPGDRKLKQKMLPVIEMLQSKVEVEREKLTNILNIKATDRTPVLAQRLADTVALTYKRLHVEGQMKRTTEALKYIDNQLRKVREKLREAEEEFNRFSQYNRLISIDLQSENLLARSQEIQNEIRKLQGDRRELQGIMKRLNKFIENPAGSDHDFYTTKAGRKYESTNDKLVGLLLRKDTLLEDYTPQHPEIITARRKILESARKLVLLLQLEINGIEEKESVFTKELAEVERKTKVLMDKKLEFNRLKRKVSSYTEMTALLERKNQEALIRKAEKPEEVTIVKPALLPSRPINPPKTVGTGAMGLIIGLILGIVIAFIVETFDTSLGAIEDVEETLGTKVLGIIPHTDAKHIREGLKDILPKGSRETSESDVTYLLSHFVPKSMIAESFRALRTNIQFKETEEKVQTIAVASTSPEEGKTLVAINLAISMAQAGMKTLLVGSDLRKPTLDRILGVEMSPGLTDILVGNHAWRDTVKTVTDMIMGRMSPEEIMMTPGLDNLHLITSGPLPPSPAELMDSGRLVAFIEEAKKEYDMIIFDSTPILSTADSAVLGTKVDGVLLVYRVGSVSRGLLKRCAAQLEQVSCNLMGVVLNGIRPDVSPDFQDYKYYSSYYSYGEEGKGKERLGEIMGLPVLRKRQEGGEREGLESFLGDAAKGVQVNGGRGKRARRLSLILGAVALLTVGILWQSGSLAPSRPLDAGNATDKNVIKPALKRGTKKPVNQRKEQTVSSKSIRTASKERSLAGLETSPTKPLRVRKQVAGNKTAVVEKEISKRSTPKNRVRISRQPKGVASAKKPSVVMNSPAKKSSPEEATGKGPIRVSSRQESPASRNKPGLQKVISIPQSPPKVKAKTRKQIPPSPEKIISYPYSLYLGSFRTLERAKRAISLYSKKGFLFYWVKVEFKEKGVWFRVFAGQFEDRETAERFREKHKLKDGKVKKTPYANLIGTYTSPDELDGKILSLKGLGYSPYAIRDHDGKSRLFVGAFITKEGAEMQFRDLKSRGFLNQVVRR
jgi:capsular exopolysaccharide synthesis family protein